MPQPNNLPPSRPNRLTHYQRERVITSRALSGCLLMLTLWLAGCASAPTATGPHCPVCAVDGAEAALCLKCQAVITAEGMMTCPECGQVKSGTWCPDRVAFHFSDDGSKCCGKHRGEWDNDWGCAKFVGLDKIVFCEDCQKSHPRDTDCPFCRK